jgi:hypothetical protein
MKTKPVKWLQRPEEHDYPAAESYLALLFDDERVAKLIRQLRKARIRTFKAKDIFRASGLSLLGISNERVKADQRKIRGGVPLSPILLVRDRKHGRVIIADGYHRMCALYSFQENAEIPCKIV